MTPLMIVGAVVLILLVSGLRIAQEYERGVVFRLGRFRGLRGPGLFWIVPLAIERAVIIDIRTRTVSAEQQETITRDSVTNKLNVLLNESISGSTESWGIEVERFEMKDVELPEAMQQVMAMQAEAIREKRARIIKAEAELEASEKLAAASAKMAGNPAALELRRMQMIAEVGAENNSTTVLMIPSEFATLSKTLSEYLRERLSDKA